MSKFIELKIDKEFLLSTENFIKAANIKYIKKESLIEFDPTIMNSVEISGLSMIINKNRSIILEEIVDSWEDPNIKLRLIFG